jgi:hypothetical protein
MLEVMLRRLANEAVRTDPRALKLMLSLMDRYAEAPEVGPQLEEMLAEDREILERDVFRLKYILRFGSSWCIPAV